jgi:arylsulfatase A-like enzyme
VVPDEVLFLSEHLRANGFQTAAISANPFIKAKHGFEQGWDHFECTAGTDQADGSYVFPAALEWVKEHKENGRFLMYIQSMDCHSPYEVDRKYSELYHPEPYDGRIGPSFSSGELGLIMRDEMSISEADWKWVQALYYGDATYHDEQLGAFLDGLDELGLLEDTMVALTNDHGEELNDHGSVGHTWTSHEELIRSPLLLYYPPIFPAGRNFAEVVETVDLSPTIVDALGLPPLPDADGASLLPLTARVGERLRPYYAVTDHRTHVRVVHVGRWRLKVDHRVGWVSLHDLAVDPGEHEDRRDDANLGGWMCEVYLGEALASPCVSERLQAASRKRELRQKVQALDADTRAELEAAGYIDGTSGEDHEKK